MNKQKVVFFSQSPIHYRKNIYLLMDRELGIDFFYGDNRPGKIKPFDVTTLQHFKGWFHNINCGPFYWQKGVLKLLKSNYDVIITPGDTYCLSSWALMFLAKHYNKKVFLWTHGAYGDEKGLKLFLTKLRVKVTACSLLYGNYAKDLLVKYGADENKLRVIYNSLDYDEQILMRGNIKKSPIYEEHFANDNKNLVFIGRLTKIKKLDQVLRALANLNKDKARYNVTFIGDGSEKDALVKLTMELTIEDNVWFYGACYDEKQIADFLYNADLCVSPGNVGLTAMHAMTFGCPVVSHSNMVAQMPEVEAIEDGLTGTYFKENSIESLADSVQRWFSFDIERENVRKNCYRVIDEKYNPHVQVETIRKALNEL